MPELINGKRVVYVAVVVDLEDAGVPANEHDDLGGDINLMVEEMINGVAGLEAYCVAERDVFAAALRSKHGHLSEAAIADYLTGVEFHERGDVPTPGDAQFIGEDEENQPDAVERAAAEQAQRVKLRSPADRAA